MGGAVDRILRIAHIVTKRFEDGCLVVTSQTRNVVGKFSLNPFRAGVECALCHDGRPIEDEPLVAGVGFLVMSESGDTRWIKPDALHGVLEL